MSELIEECRKMNRMVKESKEYKRYMHAKNALGSNEELLRGVEELKRKYSDIQEYGEDNPYDEVYQLCSENDDLLHNSIVNEYLTAECTLSRLIQNMLSEVTDGIDI